MDGKSSLAAELRGQSGCFRFMLAGYLLAGGAGGLYGGYFLAHEVHHWLALLFSLLILEPIGITCLLALPAMIAPDSAAGTLFDWSVPRAKRAAAIVGILYLLLVAGLFGFTLLEWLRQPR
ncbi:MAG: hypothetical protein QOE82_3443 [Thermoanaerobaculia bacterium]|jgi:hypothetical protein|nr:hypothetical protein [Thermoanaerobaculia bacterium]